MKLTSRSSNYVSDLLSPRWHACSSSQMQLQVQGGLCDAIQVQEEGGLTDSKKRCSGVERSSGPHARSPLLAVGHAQTTTT